MFPKSHVCNPRELWVSLWRILSKSKVWSDTIQFDRLSTQFQEWKALYTKPCFFRKPILHWRVKKNKLKNFPPAPRRCRPSQTGPVGSPVIPPTHLLGAGTALWVAPDWTGVRDTSPGRSHHRCCQLIHLYQSCVNGHSNYDRCLSKSPVILLIIHFFFPNCCMTAQLTPGSYYCQRQSNQIRPRMNFN